MSNQWRKAKDVFRQAMELPADERAPFVRSEIEDDSTFSQVMSMLKTHFEDEGFLASPFPNGSVKDPFIGLKIGDFEILKRLGKGGMGTVYEAAQHHPRRRVAIKLLRDDHSLDDRALERFKNESEYLARLKHPNIAHVYDAGSFEDAEGTRPWFAMELIEGVTLNEFFANNEMSVLEKLDLFLKICDGVEHAHCQGIIHRDLKPANVLVVTDPSNGSIAHPKIVDFGIARFTDKERRATMTATNSVLGTLDYLSPEQINEHPEKLDHRCDVYSLGVIAFEILTGQLPHDRQTGSLSEIVSRINTGERMRLRSLNKNLPFDLEVIVSKTIHNDANQRFQSVADLASDIRRFIAGDPIVSRPPTVHYRLTRYIQKNRILVGGAATTILALLCGVVTYAVIAEQAKTAAREAKYEARKAVAVNSFMTNDFLLRLLNNVTPDGSANGQTVVELMDSAAAKVDTMFADDPLVEAAVRNEMGTIYHNRFLFDKAISQYRAALSLWENGLGPDHADTLKAVSNLALAQMTRGASDETEALLRRAYQGRKTTLGLQDVATLQSLNNLAEYLRRNGGIEEAEKLYRRALEVEIVRAGEGVKTQITMSANLGSIYLRQDKVDEALELHEAAFKDAKEIFGIEHPFTLKTGTRLAQTFDQAEKYDHAVLTMKLVLAELEKVAETNPNAIFHPYRLMARIYRHQGEQELARDALERAMEYAMESPQENASVIRKIEKDMAKLPTY